MKQPIRQTAVLIHRWAGLSMAFFLLIAGLTGSLLAWYDELERLSSPQLFLARPATPHQAALDPIQLQKTVQAAYPQAAVNALPLDTQPGRTLLFRLSPGPNGPALTDDQVFVDPYSGAIVGARKWGDPSQGLKNLMPFIYRLHYSLALDEAGVWILGGAALLWSLDCFAGAYLTFPAPARKNAAAPARPWLRRWAVSWLIRHGGGAYKLTFDVHRASSLWLWAMLFMLAWSSVSFNLPQVYRPVMNALFSLQAEQPAPTVATNPAHRPVLDWPAAQARGRALMAALARDKRFQVLSEYALYYDPISARYTYSVRSSLDVSRRWGSTQVSFDGDSGALSHVWLPTEGARGDTLGSWLASLHMAAIGGAPYKAFIMLMGLAVATLSGTGVAIWWKKRQGRRKAAAKPAAANWPLAGEKR
ncbi:PepSY-associated TM helix domain-containing protein [uncultured Aquitalea sp.]|uniref:PepSY-associated TM helix domain-containing protein n=1 Tax=uncultured Aquitalea sp. TaxID=540272 RepID=UPI0025D123E1|nr:PepSY-associated TM helix domain-containing protein [uncultured Aquitalea sp.]